MTHIFLQLHHPAFSWTRSTLSQCSLYGRHSQLLLSQDLYDFIWTIAYTSNSIAPLRLPISFTKDMKSIRQIRSQRSYCSYSCPSYLQRFFCIIFHRRFRFLSASLLFTAHFSRALLYTEFPPGTLLRSILDQSSREYRSSGSPRQQHPGDGMYF